MSLRERILMVGMAGVLGWGAWSLCAPLFKRDAPDRTEEEKVKELGDFVAATRVSVAATVPTLEELRVLKKADAPWAGSPFLAWTAPAAASAQGLQTAPEREPEFRYTGYVRLGDCRLAIVNGREYRISESIPSTDFIVHSIEADRVVLVSKSGGRELTIALKGARAVKGAP